MRKNPGATSWRERAHLLLDAAESGVPQTPRTTLALAEAVGVSRQTIWRDAEIKARLKALACGSATRSSKAATLAGLRVENAALRLHCDKLMATFVVIAQRLEDRGLSAAEIMGSEAESFEPIPWD